jgi:hypothetical protein
MHSIRQEKILGYLVRRAQPIPMAQIGKVLGGYHESMGRLWVAPPLQRLVCQGWVVRTVRGFYEATPEGKIAYTTNIQIRGV